MTIERDGKVIELTDGELLNIYWYMKRKFKEEDVVTFLEDNGYDVDSMSEELIGCVTDSFEDLYNDDCAWLEAIEEAKDRYPELESFKKVRSDL